MNPKFLASEFQELIIKIHNVTESDIANARWHCEPDHMVRTFKDRGILKFIMGLDMANMRVFYRMLLGEE